MKIILKIGKKLPKFIKKPLSFIYDKWNFKVDKGMVNNLAEYSNLGEKEVIWLLMSAERLNGDLWHILNPKTKEEIEQFYSTCPFYVFELAFWHMKRYQKQFREDVINLAKGNILDFGGGIGDLSIELTKKGFSCDYADVYGVIFEFARWLFRKQGCEIEMINLSKDNLSKKYDTIFCIDMIEHVIEQKQVLENLVTHLNPKGRLIITNLNATVLARHPMHFPMKFDGEKYLGSLGLSKSERPWLWTKSLETNTTK